MQVREPSKLEFQKEKINFEILERPSIYFKKAPSTKENLGKVIMDSVADESNKDSFKITFKISISDDEIPGNLLQSKINLIGINLKTGEPIGFSLNRSEDSPNIFSCLCIPTAAGDHAFFFSFGSDLLGESPYHVSFYFIRWRSQIGYYRA